MFVVAVYDVSQERNAPILNFLRTRMDWVQNSVFEGNLTKAELHEVKDYLKEKTKTGDSIIIYKLGNKKYVSKEVIGEEKGDTSNIL